MTQYSRQRWQDEETQTSQMTLAAIFLQEMCVSVCACACVYSKLLPALRSPCHCLTGDICSSSLDLCAICIHGRVRVCYTTCRTASHRKDSNLACVGINTAERATDNWLLSINLPRLCAATYCPWGEGTRGNGPPWKGVILCKATDVEMAKMCLNSKWATFVSWVGSS